MVLWQRYLIMLTVAIGIGISLTSFKENKISQCQKLIEVVNNAVIQAKSITTSPNLNDTKVMVNAADLMDNASKEMEGTKVKDRKLQDYRSGFINMYRDISKAIRDFAVAFEKKDRKAAEAAQINLQQATTPEKQLVNDLNIYCVVK